MFDPEHKLYYMAHIRNAPTIPILGILSYNQVRSTPALDKLSVSIADPFVNMRRHRLRISGRSLHDYVPLYWATHTPMQYVTVRDGVLREDDLVFFVPDALRVFRLPGVMTTDGNAASQETKFWEGEGALPHLDWNIIHTPNCFSREYKRCKCAEVLVLDRIAPDCISYIAVRTEQVASALRSILTTPSVEMKKLGAPDQAATEVRVCSAHYYH